MARPETGSAITDGLAPWSLLDLWEAARFVALNPFDDGRVVLDGDGTTIAVHNTFTTARWDPGVEVIREYVNPLSHLPLLRATQLILGATGAGVLTPDGAQVHLAHRGGELRGRVVHAGSTTEVIADAARLSERLITDELGRLVEEHMPEVTARLRVLDRDLAGITRWDWNGEVELLRVQHPSGPKELPAFILGSFLRAASSFRWAWANETVPRSSAERAGALREQSTGPGLGGFRRGVFHCDEGLARLLACIGGASLGVRAVWPAGSGDLLFFFALP